MAAVISRLPTPFLQGDKLVAKVDKSHSVTFASEFEPEKAPIKR
jgi:hypothetical protein